MKNKIMTPEEWILITHPDPDNIHECNVNYFDRQIISYPIKEDVAYKLMNGYSKYVLHETNKELIKEIENRIKMLKGHTYSITVRQEIKALESLLTKLI